MAPTPATISVRVQPRARRDEIVAVRDGVVVVRVTAPPLDGRANAAVCRLVADTLGVPRSSVTVLRGERSRDKLVRVDQLDQTRIDQALAGWTRAAER